MPTPLKNMSSSVGLIIPNIWENKKCSKPPTSLDKAPFTLVQQSSKQLKSAIVFGDIYHGTSCAKKMETSNRQIIVQRKLR
jgi:hypothetical protein